MYIFSVMHCLELGDNPSKLSRGALITSTETAMLRLQNPKLQIAGVCCGRRYHALTLRTSGHLDLSKRTGVKHTARSPGYLLEEQARERITFHYYKDRLLRELCGVRSLVRAARVEWYLRDPGCALEFVYKGTRHPADAPVCEGASNIPADGEPSLVRPARASCTRLPITTDCTSRRRRQCAG